jgi:large subunit ribosomal protein L30
MTRKCLLAIRIRGGVNASYKIEETLDLLGMKKNNYATLIDDRDSYKGMLQKTKDYVTWGEPSIETVHLLLEKRAETIGGNPLNIETIGEIGYKSLLEVASDIYNCKISIQKVNKIKSFFRLHPPRRGYKKSIKRSFQNKGELGNRGNAINELVKRMI